MNPGAGLRKEAQAQIALNEATRREVNEAIERGRWPGEAEAPVSFRCECGKLGCADLIELRMADYEQVRANPRRFVVAPGHIHHEAEVIAEDRGRYLVVEKVAHAGEVAEATDPRTG